MAAAGVLYRTFAFRTYPTRAQAHALDAELAEACRLYNAALQELREAYGRGKTVTFWEQSAQVSGIRKSGNLDLHSAGVAHEVVRRAHRTWGAYISRIKRGEKPGFPRYKPVQRFNALTYRQYGDSCKIRENNRLYLRGIGTLRIKWHRAVNGRIKTTTIRRDRKRWYVNFVAECLPEPLPPNQASIGIDLGLSSFATLSDGSLIANPRFYENAQRKLRRLQRRMERRQNRSRRREFARDALRRQHGSRTKSTSRLSPENCLPTCSELRSHRG